MIYQPEKYKKEIKDVNLELSELKGTLDDHIARITLGKFLRRNLGFTTELISGVKLAPYQIITIKAMLTRNFGLCVFSRGAGKTFTAAMYCILQCLFNKGTNILVAGPTFRTSRFIFANIEKICETPEAKLLFACFGAKARRNDEWKWSINGGSIVAIPLNGEKIRGFRANVLVIDEFLLMSEEMVEKVLIPYLVAPQDIGYRLKIRSKEDNLIKKGLLKESDRREFSNDAKMIALSSASYTCEYLYRKYEEYLKAIYSPDLPKNGASYFIAQLAWDAIPKDMLDKSIIELAQSNEANSAIFAREYGAQFTDGSDSYFSMKKMLTCSIPDGQDPTLLVKGKRDKKYILAIDPNFSNSPTADHFAMCLVELDDGEKVSGTVVHSYAKAGCDLKDHIKYIYYLLTNFNIVMMIIDYAGYQVLDACNENELFLKSRINLKIFDFTSEKDGVEYEEELKKARKAYNIEHNCIVFTQYFTTDFIRKGNEWLQGCIDYKKIWFGSPIKGSQASHEKAVSANINLDLLGLAQAGEEKGETIEDFIDEQEALIKQTRYQCAAIEVKTTVKGTQSFDLPQIMKRDGGAKRTRKDSYTAIMLASWGMKCYFEIINANIETATATFEPFFTG